MENTEEQNNRVWKQSVCVHEIRHGRLTGWIHATEDEFGDHHCLSVFHSNPFGKQEDLDSWLCDLRVVIAKAQAWLTQARLEGGLPNTGGITLFW